MRRVVGGIVVMRGMRCMRGNEVRLSVTLSNGMTCDMGYVWEEGVSVDVYVDSERSELAFMEHGYKTHNEHLLKLKREWSRDDVTLLLPLVEAKAARLGLL